MTSPFTARDLWRTGFVLSYRAELRTEEPGDMVNLFDVEPAHYEQLTRAVLGEVSLDVQVSTGPARFTMRPAFRNGHVAQTALDGGSAPPGQSAIVLRLFKGLFTFHGGIDYILWKIERHSGAQVEVAPRLRRLPILGVCIVFWRVVSSGGIPVERIFD